jgi:trans-aconitate methyltransferase
MPASNREAYDSIAAQWDEARRAFYGREQHYLDLLLEGLAAPSRILDLGCGTGRPMAEYVLGRGHCVTGVDQSKALLALARSRFPQATWLEARLEDFEPDGPYAGAICWDALFHVPRSHHAAILQRVASRLLPGGKLMITVGGSAHEPFEDTMFGETFAYDSHPPETALALVRDCGLEVVLGEFMNLPTSGRDKGRYAIVARKPPGKTGA